MDHAIAGRDVCLGDVGHALGSAPHHPIIRGDLHGAAAGVGWARGLLIDNLVVTLGPEPPSVTAPPAEASE